MRRSSVLEGIDIFLDGVDRNFVSGGSLGQELGLVNTLGSRCNFLTTHEKVVGVSVVRVMRVNHCIEWTSIYGIAVKHIEISLVLFTNESTKSLLVLSAKVLKRILDKAVVSKELNTLLKAKSDILAKEGLERILIIDNFEFFSKSLVKSLENMHKHLGKKIENLKIVLLKCHFDIEACELAEMTISI